jgi:hypothetical protein
MANESTLWHTQVKEEEEEEEEEMYSDNEMALNPTLYLFISFSSVSQLLMTSNPSKISPRLTRD